MMGCECPSKAAEMIRREYPGIDEKKLTRAHMYMAKLDNAAARGEEWALRLAFERTEGKPKDQNYTEDNRGLILSAIDEALK
jgi:dsRNA-specific ribonuclease